VPFTLPYLLSFWVGAAPVMSEKSLLARVAGLFFWRLIFVEILGDNSKLDRVAR
jgi:hypothetical protein